VRKSRENIEMANLQNLIPGQGRPLGAKNKPKAYDVYELTKHLAARDFDAVDRQIDLYDHPETPASVKYKINECFLQLIYPKVKAVQHSGTIEHHAMQIALSQADPMQTIDATPIPDTLTVDTTVEETVTPTVEDNESDF
jgi:hypothetical protein